MKTNSFLKFFTILLHVLFVFCLFSIGNCVAQNNRQWATYFGGTGDDYGYSIATDKFGNVYLAGYTASTSGIALNGFQNTYGGGSQDAFLVKLDSAGNRIWATYYGGTGNDYGQSVATDAFGNVYLGGYSNSSTSIASAGFQNTFGGGSSCGGLPCKDAFLVKFDASGNRLWATYYGGTGEEIALSITIDLFGNAYLAGQTTSSLGIAFGGFQNAFGGGFFDSFLVKFDATGNRLWATYYGGVDKDYGTDLATDLFGNVYLTGHSSSISGIASVGFQNNFGGGTSDAFLVKFDAAGNRLWATYYGGVGGDLGYSTVTDALGNVYLTGLSNSASGIAFNGFQNILGGVWDAFLVKFDSSGNRLWGSYYGGIGNEVGNNITTDTLGNVYLAGETYSSSGIASGGFQNIFTQWDECFVAKFNPYGNRLCATYYGGPPGANYYDKGGSVALDISGNVYLTGNTESALNIASGGFQNTFGGGDYDAFLVKFTTCCNAPPVAAMNGTSTICNGQTVILNASGGETYLWSTNDTTNSISVTPIITTSHSVIVFNGCGSDTALVTITVNPSPIAAIIGNTSICSGQSTALIASGGGTYIWNTGSTVDTITVSPTINSSYSVIVSDGICSDTTLTMVTISIPHDATFSYGGTPYCVNAANPLPVYLGGGTSGTFASTSGLSINPITGQINLVVSTPGIYNVTNIISASGGCPGDTATSNITIVASEIATFMYSNNPYCKTDVNPLPTFLGGGTAGTYTSSMGLIIDANTGEIDLSSSTAGIYTVTNTIAALAPCSSVVENTTITITEFPSASFSYISTPYCQNIVDPLPSYILGGIGGIFISTTGLSIDTSSGQIDLSASTIGTYTITNTISASMGCPAVNAIATITITGPEANAGQDVIINLGSSSQLNATGSGSFSWSPLDGLSCNDCPNPIASPLKTTTYTLTVVDTNGCSVTKTLTITVNDDFEIFVPDVFSPNGDGENDILYVRGTGIKEVNFVVYDRLGEKIFESNDITKGWDGSFNGSPLNSAVFIYYLSATLFNEKEIKTKGDITLIR